MTHDADLPDLSPEAEAALQARLAELKNPTIPIDVANQIQSVLAAESAKRSAEQNSNVRGLTDRSWVRRVLPVAAAGVVIAVVGFAVWPAINSPQAPQTLAAAAGCTVSADLGSDLSSVLRASGVSYSDTTLKSRAESMSAQPTKLCEAEAERTLSGAVEDSATAESLDGADPLGGETNYWASETELESGESPEASVAMRDLFPAGGGEQHVRTCVVTVLEGREVEVVDVARFDGRPAVVVVVRSPREVLVLDCEKKRSSVVAHQSMSTR